MSAATSIPWAAPSITFSPAGLQPLREAVAAKTARDSGLEIGANQVVITNGGKQAIANAFLTMLDPGDEVIVPAPYWVTFPEAVALAGGVPVPIGTTVADGFRVTVEQLEESCTARTSVYSATGALS